MNSIRARILLGMTRWLPILLVSYGTSGVLAAPADFSGVESLRYRQILYSMYLGKFARAETELAALRERGELRVNSETELLDGLLLYGAGIPAEAMNSFKRVLTQEDVNTFYSDLAWFHYAKSAKMLGDAQGMQLGLVSIRNQLPGELEQERRFFKVNQLVAEEKFDEAGAVVASMDTRHSWSAYAAYNRGVGCLSKNLRVCGEDSLKLAGEFPARNAEGAALRDKSRIALGFWKLTQNEPRQAIGLFRQVSFDGPFSNRALLGLGWSYAAASEFSDALRVWDELRGRDTLDIAVQEGLLASGYAYNRLKSNPLALMNYRQASSTYKEVQDNLDASLSTIRNGDVVSWLPVSLNDKVLSEELARFNREPAKKPILRALSSQPVREEYRLYRDIVAIDAELRENVERFALYDAVLDERYKRQRERATALRQRVKSARPDWLERRFATAQRTLISSDPKSDGLQFSRDTEIRQLQKLQVVYERLARLPLEQWPPNAYERYAALRGVLLWNIYVDVENRRKEFGVQLAEVEKSLTHTKELWRRMELLDNVDQLPVAKLKKRVTQIREKMKSLMTRVSAIKHTQGERISQTLGVEVDAERQHVASYLAQAQYAVARLFDEATASGEAQ